MRDGALDAGIQCVSVGGGGLALLLGPSGRQKQFLITTCHVDCIVLSPRPSDVLPVVLLLLFRAQPI